METAASRIANSTGVSLPRSTARIGSAVRNMSVIVETGWNPTVKVCDSVEIPLLTRCCFCFPLRKGLITFAYFNLILTVLVTSFLILFMTQTDVKAEFPRMVADTTALVLETCMIVVFIIALHKKNVLLMKGYLYFEIVFSAIGFVYSLVFLTKESASELFLILFQLTLQTYLVILIWSSIVKMERDGAVKYTRDRENV